MFQCCTDARIQAHTVDAAGGCRVGSRRSPLESAMKLAPHLSNTSATLHFPKGQRGWLPRMILLLVATFGLAAGAWADPPGRVGRVNWTEGSVTLTQAPDPEHDAESVDAPRNWPVTTGDALSTGDNARTEVSIGSTLVRLHENTKLQVTRIDDEAVVLRLVEGSLALNIRNSEMAHYIEVQAGSARMVPQGAGLFRFDARQSTLTATAWRSALLVDAPGADLTLTSGQRADFGAGGGWYRMNTPEID